MSASLLGLVGLSEELREARRPRSRVTNYEAFAEDLEHATQAGREVALAARARLERDVIPGEELRACDAEGPDGTRLASCVKTYLPQPDGDWAMVLRGWDREGPGLAYLAFGLRHPRQPWEPASTRSPTGACTDRRPTNRPRLAAHIRAGGRTRAGAARRQGIGLT